MATNRRHFLFTRWVRLGVGLLLMAACGGKTNLEFAGADSESHFLSFCIPGGCEFGLECVFGLCTQPCSDDTECAALNSQATCQKLGPTGQTVLACDVACDSAADCGSDGSLVCEAGSCREALVSLASALVSCSSKQDCDGPRSHCRDGICTQECEEDTDCENIGGVCSAVSSEGNFLSGDYRPINVCATPCGQPNLAVESHAECQFLGEQGRCLRRGLTEASAEEFGGICLTVEGGACGDAGQPNAEWRCLEEMAAETLVRRSGEFLSRELCVPQSFYNNRGIAYSICGDQRCASGEVGCALTGLNLTGVLEDVRIDSLDSDGRRVRMPGIHGQVVGTEASVMSATLSGVQEGVCSLSLNELTLSVKVASWVLERFRTSSILYPTGALEPGLPISHLGGSYVFAEENMEPPWDVAKNNPSPSVPCSGLLVPEVAHRFSLLALGAVRDELYAWAYDWQTALDCRQCGKLGCEMVCRYR